jgi:leucyl aminopeptidase (aminopeptidase T)
MATDHSAQVELLLDTCMGVRAREQVLLVTDARHAGLARALSRGAERRRASPTVVMVPPRRLYEKDAAGPLDAAMAASDVVVLCLPPEHSCQLWHTGGRERASVAGARIGLLFPPASWEISATDLLATRKLAAALALLLDHATSAHITSRAGTDVRLDLTGRPGFACSSILHGPGETATVPDWGDAEISPVEGSAEGEAVIDGSMAFVGLIREPIRISIEGGRAVAVEGGREARRLRRVLSGADASGTNLAEFGIGTVARGGFTGHKDDHLLGTCHLAFGHNVSLGGQVESNVHLDGVMRLPTIELDGRVVMRNGELDRALVLEKLGREAPPAASGGRQLEETPA